MATAVMAAVDLVGVRTYDESGAGGGSVRGGAAPAPFGGALDSPSGRVTPSVPPSAPAATPSPGGPAGRLARLAQPHLCSANCAVSPVTDGEARDPGEALASDRVVCPPSPRPFRAGAKRD